MLELIDVGHCTSEHPVPILFVHGLFHGAWCWAEHFLGYFVDSDFRAAAVSLRGHGSSPAGSGARPRIADYVCDVDNAISRIGTAPILVGQSLGGFVVQKYLEDRTLPEAALLASAPPRTVWRSAPRLLVKHPWLTLRMNLTGSRPVLVGTAQLVREHLFCSATPDSIVNACTALIQPENPWIQWDMSALNRIRPDRVSTPMLVVGAERDGLITPSQVRDTAQAYRTTAQIARGMGHNVMLEPGWRPFAELLAK
jgi:pimeloyl-ACP methyl ester carboxylesterase